ncbi:MAG: hypothetical protein ABSF85_09945, partial [Terriglobales bacterium]
VLVVLLYGTLVLAERRSGYAIMLLVGLFAAATPVMHMRGAHYGEIAASTGRGLHLHPLGARTVESATGPATVVLQPEHGKADLEVLCRLRPDDPGCGQECPRHAGFARAIL